MPHRVFVLTSYVIQQIQQLSCADTLLGPKSQTLAAWIYTLATAALLLFVVRQVRHAYQQLRQVENQLAEMRATRDLDSFVTFIKLWDDEEVRDARRNVYRVFGPAVRKKDALEKQIAFESIIGSVAGQQLKDIDRVINKSNLVGLLWSEGLLSPSMRNVVLPYIYKTVIQTWNCLQPYVQYVRSRRAEVSPATITYAAPFEALWKEAEALRQSRGEEVPVPSDV